LVNPFQVLTDGFAVLVADIFGRVPDQMDDTELYGGFGKYGLYGLWKTR